MDLSALIVTGLCQSERKGYLADGKSMRDEEAAIQRRAICGDSVNLVCLVSAVDEPFWAAPTTATPYFHDAATQDCPLALNPHESPWKIEDQVIRLIPQRFRDSDPKQCCDLHYRSLCYRTLLVCRQLAQHNHASASLGRAVF